jgi:hypothetical protein
LWDLNPRKRRCHPEIEITRKSLEASPTMLEAFDEDWIDKNFLNAEERYKKHTMFWIFLEEL